MCCWKDAGAASNMASSPCASAVAWGPRDSSKFLPPDVGEFSVSPVSSDGPSGSPDAGRLRNPLQPSDLRAGQKPDRPGRPDAAAACRAFTARSQDPDGALGNAY